MATSFADRMIGAARLDVRTYEEVEADSNALGQAMGVVVLSSIGAGIGAAGLGGPGIIITLIVSLIGWFLWAGLTFLIGTKLLPEPQTKADIGEVLRTTGFAAAPGIARVLGIVPLLGGLLSLAASVWMLVAMVVAVKQALDYKSVGRAIAVCVIGFAVYMAAAFVQGLFFMTGSALLR